ncbi:hypothetical protein N185_15735 [Sinorhizobium sp. GW3]|nr:hypothetical protein N185_15735 [Sinorhizobium sp. GW3]
MRGLGSVIAAFMFTAGSAFASSASFVTADGVRIFARYQAPQAGVARGTIILLHMAGSNKDEYRPLATILNKAGFSTLAIDQRSGGNLWGSENETARQAKGRRDFPAALPDLDAAISYARSLNGDPIILWGSSYSAALAFVAASHDRGIRALLAFSPAEYIEGYSIQEAAAQLSIPVFIASAPNQSEIESAGALAQAVPNNNAVQYVPKFGRHGSSTLRPDENPLGAQENWKHVITFLDNVAPR